jgi:plastocyanin
MKPINYSAKGAFILMAVKISAMVLLVSCSKSSDMAPASSPAGNTSGNKTNSVSIVSMAFSPTTLTVAVGTTVTWTNNDSAAHTVTSDTGLFDSGNLSAAGSGSSGGSFSFTFNNAGTFNYHCTYHSMMVAKVIVQ